MLITYFFAKMAMFNVSLAETDQLISRYVPQLGKKLPIQVVNLINDSLTDFFKGNQAGVFQGDCADINISERQTSSKFHQHIISVNIRKDEEFLKNNKMTKLMKNIIGLPIHSQVLKENVPSATMHIINYLIKHKSIYFNDERIIINNTHPLISAILIYIFCHIDNVLTIYYQHINNKKLNGGDFKATYDKYLKANQEHTAQLVEIREKKQKEEEIAKNQISVDNVKMTQEELDGYSVLTEKQKQEFLKRKILLDSKRKSSKPLFITKRHKPEKVVVKEESNIYETESKSWSLWKSKTQKNHEPAKPTQTKSVLDKYTTESSHGNDVYKSGGNDFSFSAMSEHAYLNNPVGGYI